MLHSHFHPFAGVINSWGTLWGVPDFNGEIMGIFADCRIITAKNKYRYGKKEKKADYLAKVL
jgi:hypothetical protein